MILLPLLILHLPTLAQPDGQGPGQVPTPPPTSQIKPALEPQPPYQLPATPPKAPPSRTQDISVPPPVTMVGPDSVLPEISRGPLTANEAAAIGLRFSTTLGNFTGAVQQARGRTLQVQSQLLPTIGAFGGITQLTSVSGSGNSPLTVPDTGIVTTAPTSNDVGAALYLRQLVYDFDMTRNLVRQDRALERVAQQNLTRAQLQVVFNVKNAFYVFATATNVEAVNEQNVANRQRQLDLANARLTNGIGSPSDVVLAQTTKSQAILALNVARDNVEQARISLLGLMGVDPQTPISADLNLEKEFPDRDAKHLVKLGLQYRPEVLSAEQEVAASKFGLSAAKAVDLPSIVAAVAAGSRGNAFPLSDSTAAFQIGINIPIIDGGLRRGSIDVAKGVLTSSNADLKTAIETVRSDVSSAYLQLESAEQRQAIADNEVTNAQEGVRVAEGRYRSGLGLFLDILNAQSLLLQAQTDYQNAVDIVNRSRTRLRYAIGEGLNPVR